MCRLLAMRLESGASVSVAAVAEKREFSDFPRFLSGDGNGLTASEKKCVDKELMSREVWRVEEEENKSD
jgi:hypothetical protein